MQQREHSKETKKDIINLAWGLGFRIAAPIVFLALVGRVLDRYVGTAPIFLLGGIIVSPILSAYLIYRELKSTLKENI